MASSAAQNVLLDDSGHPPERIPPTVIEVSPAAIDDDRLPPPTKAQLFYWRQLAGEVHRHGAVGLRDEEWPPDLAPQSQTLRQLVVRRILVRRGRAWHLRRRWYERLTALRTRAVDTPPLTRAERPAPDLPTYAELEAWEALCRWLDLQPKQRAHLPFLGLTDGPAAPARGPTERADTSREGDGERHHQEAGLDDEQVRQQLSEQARQLRGMRRYRLVRHLGTCEWALSPRWCDQLHALWQGVNRALREYRPPQLAPAMAPRSLCAGLDTWGLNWLVEEQALPARLRRDLDDLQQQAQRAEQEVETPWIFDGAPLLLYQTGVRSKNGKGVSWSYVLVNPSLRLLIRRVPLGGVVANARLGSECLWRRTPRAALDELHALIGRLWGKDVGRWQVSYAHLAHDVANAPIEREQLDRYISRSRRRAIYDAAQAEMRRMLRETRLAYSVCEDAEEDEDLILELGYDWEEEFAGEEENLLLLADPFAEEGDAWEQAPRRRVSGAQARDALEEKAEQRACHAYVWGKRLSGVAFSPGGAVSFVMYRKDWEGRLKSKRHMEPLWTAAGWDGKEPVTRYEARLVREPIRELHLAGVAAAVLDDPWQFLDHEHDVWAAIVGRSGNETCPDAVDVAWIRRVVPREGESNRSRWDTDPVWRVVQQASFTPTPLAARRMIRRRQREQEVKKLDRQLLGVLKKREALLHPDPSGRDVSLALRDVVVPLERELVARGEQFDQAVRAKRQACGLPVPLAGRVLPLRPVPRPEEVDAHHQLVRDLEQRIPPEPTAPTALRPTAAVMPAEAGSTAAGWVGRTGGPGGESGPVGEQRMGAPDGDAAGEAVGEAAGEARWERWERWERKSSSCRGWNGWRDSTK